MIGSLPGSVAALLSVRIWRWWRRRPEPDPPLTLVLLLLLVQLRSGQSVLAALIEVSRTLPGYESLRRVSRAARVAGLSSAIVHADGSLRPVVAHLARAQRTGASLTGAVRRMLETELAEDRARRTSRARALPVRLMIPITLFMLPGLILLLYAPSLLGMFEDLTGVLR
jgi:hypothetical protein